MLKLSPYGSSPEAVAGIRRAAQLAGTEGRLQGPCLSENCLEDRHLNGYGPYQRRVHAVNPSSQPRLLSVGSRWQMLQECTTPRRKIVPVA